MGNLVAVCGIKNSGKTTLLEKLVRALSERKIQTAVIKHDGHDFTCDMKGTDSYRLKEAGAFATAVFSKDRVFIHKTGTKETEKELISMFPEADLILLEGMKDSAYPKIEIVRKGISEVPVSNPDGRFLIVTDHTDKEFGEKTAGFEEIDKILKCIFEIIKT